MSSHVQNVVLTMEPEVSAAKINRVMSSSKLLMTERRKQQKLAEFSLKTRMPKYDKSVWNS